MSEPTGDARRVTREQALASDPRASAWVSANAGSGKTHVLTQRVLRLLLDGAKPAQILGLTFTKAAAANMAGRIFDALANWTRLSDEKLMAAIVATGAPRPEDAATLKRARRLFARTIESPGGLKIQTLHAFCERLLHLFPFEANAPAHFRVLDEGEAGQWMRLARDEALAALAGSPADAARLASVAREAGAGDGVDALIAETLGEREAFEDDDVAYAARLGRALGLPDGTTVTSVEAAILGGAAGAALRRGWARALLTGSPRDHAIGETLSEVDAGANASVGPLFEAFFTKGGEGEPRGGAKGALVTKTLAGREPSLEPQLQREQSRLATLRDRWRAARVLERSLALRLVAGAILGAYARLKGERGLLDFDDQIAGALALVTRADAAWVRHKLDSGLDHLLVDEAQDTSSAQWRILTALTDDFFAGAARPGRRTLFAVGDEKQSIFAFQGAAPEKFGEMKRFFETRHRTAEMPFAATPLHVSFRSSAVVLKAVDAVFAAPEAWRGVGSPGEPAPNHEAFRAIPGAVEIWPPIAPAPEAERDEWRLPLDAASHDDPPVRLAKRIADVVAGWLAPGSPERIVDKEGQPRPIRAGDVMILVRKRGVFFEAMIRALKMRAAPTAGADRLKLREHIAVMDLVALGRAALQPQDDLTLAAALKSPLFGLDDDALMRIAFDRRGSLAEALAASPREDARSAALKFAQWRARARVLTPYAFYARLLGEDGGRRALLARLGEDAADPIDEFLALALTQERVEAPSLSLLLDEVEANETAIKRDMETEAEGVRVLTVHAAKGLEAPIVFLPDTCSGPGGGREAKLHRLAESADDAAPLLAWGRRKAEDPPALAAARELAKAAEAGEHRRLLYVAMTRAAQRLIVAGYEGRRGRAADCWHNLVTAGLAPLASLVSAPWGGGETALRLGDGLAEAGAPAAMTARASAMAPPWLAVRAAPEAAPVPLAPSRALAAPQADPLRLEAGRLAHALLQRLPEVAPAERAAAAERFLAAEGVRLDPPTQARLAAQTLATLAAPDLQALFGADSRAEVAFAGQLARPGRVPLPYAGRLDRMAIAAGEILIADFKLGSAPATAPDAYVTQLALYRAALAPLYPGLPIRATLVYLDDARAMWLKAEALDEALARVIAGP